MADRFTIQRVPRGVLELLGLRGSGDLPHDMAQEIRATLDIGPFYGFDLLRTPSSLLSAMSAGFNTSTALTVPAGEMWAVTNISAEISTAAASAATVNIGYKRLQDNTGPPRMIGLPSVVLGASQTVSMGVPLAFGVLILASGDTIGCRAHTITTTVNALMAVDYYRLLF